VTITNARGHLSSETIDLLLLSALSANEANEAKAHIDGCTFCKQRWVELNEDSQKFKQFVFARTLPAVEARLNESKQGFFERFKLAFVLPALGVATAAALALTLTSGPGTQTEDDVYIGVKGLEPTFEVFAQRQQGSTFALKPGTSLKPKDRIRFVVNPGQAKYVLVASVDGKGVFSVYHPFGAVESEKIAGQVPRKLELGSTVELDDTTGTEKLLVILSDAPVKADAVKAALQANPAAPKIDGARVLSQEFVKVAP
jgi:hypothetical protein